MPIVDTDIKYRLSVLTGSAGNSTAQASPNNSLGKYVATTAMDLVTTLNNLFDNVSGDESAAGDIEYRCLFVLNDHATLTLENAVVWISAETAGGGAIAVGLDPAGNVAKGSASAQAAEIANESAAPAGVTFTAPTTKGTGLSIGNLAAGSVRAIWIRRTVTAGAAAVDADGVTLRVEGDTAA